MSEFPWVQFYPSDWLGGTRGMSAAETGVYITLIATMYERQAPIKEDIGRLARVCGASNSAFKKALDALVDDGKIERFDGLLWNNRVGREIEKRAEKSEVARQSAKRRWDTSNEKPQQKQQPENANAEQTQCERNANQKPDTRSHIEKKELRKSKPPYTEDYNLFWKAWQGTPARWPTHVKGEAYPHWKALTPEDQELAVGSIKPYQDACKKADHDPKHAVRYLRDRAFEGFEPQATNTLNAVTVGTPEHSALAAWKRRQGLPVFDLMPIPEGYTPPEEITP